MTSEQAKSLLRGTGLRATRDRHELLNLFEQHRAWTVVQLHKRLKTADLSTVYRNITALVEKGLLIEAGIKDKEAYYERSDRNHHAHSICRSCGAAQCVPCPLKGRNEEHSVDFFVTCNDCRHPKPNSR